MMEKRQRLVEQAVELSGLLQVEDERANVAREREKALAADLLVLIADRDQIQRQSEVECEDAARMLRDAEAELVRMNESVLGLRTRLDRVRCSAMCGTVYFPYIRMVQFIFLSYTDASLWFCFYTFCCSQRRKLDSETAALKGKQSAELAKLEASAEAVRVNMNRLEGKYSLISVCICFRLRWLLSYRIFPLSGPHGFLPYCDLQFGSLCLYEGLS